MFISLVRLTKFWLIFYIYRIVIYFNNHVTHDFNWLSTNYWIKVLTYSPKICHFKILKIRSTLCQNLWGLLLNLCDKTFQSDKISFLFFFYGIHWMDPNIIWAYLRTVTYIINFLEKALSKTWLSEWMLIPIISFWDIKEHHFSTFLVSILLSYTSTE